MMSETSAAVTVQAKGRSFPWFCPNCRRKEVWPVTIPYECQRQYKGKPITIVLSALTVPQCANCGELVFTYETEEQINRAYSPQVKGLAQSNGTTPATADSPPKV